MSVELTYRADATVKETLTEAGTPSASAGNRLITHNEFNTTAALTGSTTPPVTKVAAFVQALTGGAATIDLMSLTGTNGVTVVGDGLKVQLFKMKNLGANVMSATIGAATPYALAGADFKMTLTQNQEFTFYGNDATPDISGTVKHIDLAGTTTQTAEITIVMG